MFIYKKVTLKIVNISKNIYKMGKSEMLTVLWFLWNDYVKKYFYHSK